MILGGQHQGGATEPTRTPLEIAVFPVAMPAIAGPCALLAVVLLTDNNRTTIGQEAVTSLITAVSVAAGNYGISRVLDRSITHQLLLQVPLPGSG